VGCAARGNSLHAPPRSCSPPALPSLTAWEAYAGGAFNFLVKPPQPDELRKVVSTRRLSAARPSSAFLSAG